jgi:hypothetical protein
MEILAESGGLNSALIINRCDLDVCSYRTIGSFPGKTL